MNIDAAAVSVLALSLGLLAACSGATSSPPAGEPGGGNVPLQGETTPPSGKATGDATGGADAGATSDGGARPGDERGGDPGDGLPGQDALERIAVGEHCCFGGKYLRCPDANACLGGFDVEQCLAGCEDAQCFQDCSTKARNAGPPKGCDANAAPPAGIDCAAGDFDL